MPTSPAKRLNPASATTSNQRRTAAPSARDSRPPLPDLADFLAEFAPSPARAPAAASAKPARQKIPPLPVTHRAAEAALDELTLRHAVATGLTRDATTSGAKLNVDLLRALDAWAAAPTDARLRAQVPAWLRSAHTQAEAEMALWHVERGLPGPNDTEDPGEPQNGDAGLTDFPRPHAKTDQERLIEYLKCRTSPVYLLDSYAHLEHKVQGIIPFRLWPWQAWLLYRWMANLRNVMLKARQIGVSELAAGFAFWLERFYPTKRVIFISKSQPDAEILLGRATTMLTHMPQWLWPSPDVRSIGSGGRLDACVFGKQNLTTLELAHFDAEGRPHYSSIQSLAATENAGRGRTAALVVLDEWAAMMWAPQIWAAIKPTVDGGGRLLGISTASGVGNLFHKVYDAASQGKNTFFHCFLSWRREPTRTEAWYQEQATEYEGNGQTPILHQEYPGDALEAFIQTGNPVFEKEMLVGHKQRIEAEQATRKAEGLPGWDTTDGLTVCEEAESGHLYIIGADISENRLDGDFSTASVVCRQTGREVAYLRGKWPLEVFAAKLDELGYRYNRALLAPERNSAGQSVISNLMTGLAHERWAGKREPYPKLYHHRGHDHLAPGMRQDQRPGWHTNVQTKPLAVASLNRALREGAFQPRSLKFLDEAFYFAWAEDGKACGAQEGQHDDEVACRWIAVHLLCQPDLVSHALSVVKVLRERVEQKIAERAAGGAGRADRQSAIPDVPEPPVLAAVTVTPVPVDLISA